ncbi:MAG: sulfite exporter TauE/SafE family protein [Chitinophagales bacterium]|nr:sulfite exporter TauE/SafE family protein [Chitinophagales bacterium]
MLWTALAIGLVGSLHCVGMCGPIALALPGGFSTRWAMANSRLLYNLGRTVTYSFLGGIFGLMGKGFAIAGVQQWVSIGLGILLLVVAITSANPERLLNKLPPLRWLQARVAAILGRFLKHNSQASLFYIGLLNGLLPCGFVYVGILGAIHMGTPLMGAAYMALFGLGTIPLMFSVAMLGSIAGTRIKSSARKLIPVFMLVFAVMFIFRGLNLGIPYISPKINGIEMGKGKCH